MESLIEKFLNLLNSFNKLLFIFSKFSINLENDILFLYTLLFFISPLFNKILQCPLTPPSVKATL